MLVFSKIILVPSMRIHFECISLHIFMVDFINSEKDLSESLVGLILCGRSSFLGKPL